MGVSIQPRVRLNLAHQLKPRFTLCESPLGLGHAQALQAPVPQPAPRPGSALTRLLVRRQRDSITLYAQTSVNCLVLTFVGIEVAIVPLYLAHGATILWDGQIGDCCIGIGPRRCPRQPRWYAHPSPVPLYIPGGARAN